MPEITYNDDLGLYFMIFVGNLCAQGHTAWYYSTATSLDREDWTTPQMIANSEHPYFLLLLLFFFFICVTNDREFRACDEHTLQLGRLYRHLATRVLSFVHVTRFRSGAHQISGTRIFPARV